MRARRSRRAPHPRPRRGASGQGRKTGSVGSGDAGEDFLELVEVDGLEELGEEVGLLGEIEVVAGAGEGDALEAVLFLELADEGQSVAVGEAEIADDDVEG